MGTINYNTSKYITIGYDCRLIDDEYDWSTEIIAEDYSTVEELIKELSFEIINVEALLGYYEGYFIDISFDYRYFDDENERSDASNEVIKLKNLLTKLIDEFSLVSVKPGWCTAYRSRNDSLKELNIAIDALIKDIDRIPLYEEMDK